MESGKTQEIRVLVPLAEGAEEIEAVTIIDLLRRAGFTVVVAGLHAGPVHCSRGTVIVPDTTLADLDDAAFDLIVLPGGLPGADHLAADSQLIARLQRHARTQRPIGAICAAPKVLDVAGLLAGKRFTAYAGTMGDRDALSTGNRIESDSGIITGRGPGVAMDFALELIETLAGSEKRAEVEKPLVR